ncbi:hypothetical protein PsorP6_009931 [Peronosclerospora sorghi]|uniref:Uncharacterized protein n=1 Tax=Peronosclerospora sorghi TaxID=230839 RepID=A0ACC0VW79_9STRA|nr:hypothetical protein PsorP6_009931 [Peronosclerospora sorghi]
MRLLFKAMHLCSDTYSKEWCQVFQDAERTGIPQVTVRPKTITESVDIRELDLGKDASISQLIAVSTNGIAVIKPRHARK